MQSDQRSQDSGHLQEEFGWLLSHHSNWIDPGFWFCSQSRRQDGRLAELYQIAGGKSDRQIRQERSMFQPRLIGRFGETSILIRNEIGFAMNKW